MLEQMIKKIQDAVKWTKENKKSFSSYALYKRELKSLLVMNFEIQRKKLEMIELDAKLNDLLYEDEEYICNGKEQ